MNDRMLDLLEQVNLARERFLAAARDFASCRSQSYRQLVRIEADALQAASDALLNCKEAK